MCSNSFPSAAKTKHSNWLMNHSGGQKSKARVRTGLHRWLQGPVENVPCSWLLVLSAALVSWDPNRTTWWRESLFWLSFWGLIPWSRVPVYLGREHHGGESELAEGVVPLLRDGKQRVRQEPRSTVSQCSPEPWPTSFSCVPPKIFTPAPCGPAI